MRARFPSEEAERVQIRMPDGMRDELKLAAESNGRSMNAEIIHRLKQVGSAGAATPPSHGSSLSVEIRMNEADDTTTHELKPTPYREALNALETSLMEAELDCLTADYLVEDMIGSASDGEEVALDDERRRILSHAVLRAMSATRNAVKAFQALNHARAAEVAQ